MEDHNTIKLRDKEFELFIPQNVLEGEIIKVAEQINIDYKEQAPIFLSILNGAFMFSADVLKHINILNSEISFVKIASYQGTSSSGMVSELIGLNIDIKDRDVIILEDMVDSGRSMSYLMDVLRSRKPKSIKLAVMFYKPGAMVFPVEIDYHAMDIGNEFIVGHGLDYDGLGRSLPDIYILKAQ